MYLRIVAESFARSPRRKFITGAALALGMAVATATLTVALSVGDRLAAEFRSLGANLLVTPKADTLPLEIGGVDYRPVNAGAYLSVDDLPKLKQIFWRNNIVGFAPFLDVPVHIGTLEPGLDSVVPTGSTTLIGAWVRHKLDLGNGEAIETGAAITNPWWKIEGGGRWFGENVSTPRVNPPDLWSPECVVGATLAKREGIRVGQIVWIGTGLGSDKGLLVTGIAETGGPEDDAIIAPLWFAQQLADRPGIFRRLIVSAIVKPDDSFGRRDPATMTPAEVERWSCSAYISSIAANIQQALPGVNVQPIRQVAEGESRILGRVSALFWVVTLAALIAAGLAVGAVAATTVLERQKEIGLMKALGANKWLVGSFFLSEQILLAVFGGGLGFAIGVLLARWLSLSVFGVVAPAKAILLPAVLGLAILVALAGSIYPLRRAAGFDPAPILRGE
ncbi:MAG TPA: ABC transporter permease [Candidatus Acidoferrales bacterium]|jgi:putative ABC transport system permease protein|nr:ABC transporter permease [Candidatus Acidoferrales bacterium]